VFAFEASLESYAHLKANIASAGLPAKVELVNRALWSETGPLRFFEPKRLPVRLRDV